jgi:methylated-DNA-[protein]-cysteine S-methyltransferase
MVRGEGSAVIETGLGHWKVAWTEAGLCGFRPTAEALAPMDAPAWVRQAAAQLKRHLDGEPQDLRDLPLDLSSLTPFQRAVADALRRTRGGTITYGDLAQMAGRPGATRAVGRAVAANPLLVLVPCHRVVGAKDGGGWSAFGSPEVKARLMELDRL